MLRDPIFLVSPSKCKVAHLAGLFLDKQNQTNIIIIRKNSSKAEIEHSTFLVILFIPITACSGH